MILFYLFRNDVYIGCVLSYSDIDYELASVLYNIGALHSLLGTILSHNKNVRQEMYRPFFAFSLFFYSGTQSPRKTSEGLKIACTHFQCAAWAFAQLPERYTAQMSSDMGTDLMIVSSQVIN